MYQVKTDLWERDHEAGYQNGSEVDGYHLESTCFPSLRLQSEAGRKDGKVHSQGDSFSLVLQAATGAIKLSENKKLHKQN